jgi:hypothetical protein
MTPYTWPDDDETTEVSYSTLLSGTRRQIPRVLATFGSNEPDRLEEEDLATAGERAASRSEEDLPRGGGDDPRYQWQVGEHRPMRSVRGAWPLAYRRTFRVIFCSALLALGMLLGARTPGRPVAPFFHIFAAPSARQGVSTPSTAALETAEDALAPSTPVVLDALVLDARFAIATLVVHCILNPCAEAQALAAGLRIYPRQAGVSCTTISGIAVVSSGESSVYCRLDQPNVYTYNFDAAQFDCVGSQLGCHTVMIVDSTNGR